MKTETLIVGLGSSHGDDQLGWRVAERLAALADASGRHGPPGLFAGRNSRLARRGRAIDRLRCLSGSRCARPGASLALARRRLCRNCVSPAATIWASRRRWRLPTVWVLLPAEVSIWCAEGVAFGSGRIDVSAGAGSRCRNGRAHSRRIDARQRMSTTAAARIDRHPRIVAPAAPAVSMHSLLPKRWR